MYSAMPNVCQGMNVATQRRMYQEYRAGVPVECLSKRFRYTPSEIVRVIDSMRLQWIMELQLSYVSNEQFLSTIADGAMETVVLGPSPTEDSSRDLPSPADVPAYVAGLYEIPLLTRSQEAHLFRKMNYLKFKACHLREQLDPQSPAAALMDEIEQCHTIAMDIRNQLIRANLRLVVSVAKRRVGPAEAFFELVSDGNMALMRAVEKFDYARGNRFSTYAIEAVGNAFARTIPAERRRRGRFRTGCDANIESGADDRLSPRVQEEADERRQGEVAKMLERLDLRDRQIIIRRFGLQRGCEPLKLRELSSQMGVTKERIRQIELRALRKLRGLAVAENIEVPS